MCKKHDNEERKIHYTQTNIRNAYVCHKYSFMNGLALIFIHDSAIIKF